MTTLVSGLPNARIFLASVPDIERLWLVAKDNANARSVWRTYAVGWNW